MFPPAVKEEGKENSGPLSTGKGRLRNWTLREDRILLDLLIDVHLKTHGSQGTFKAHAFQDILHQFNITANVIKDKDSLKYRWRNIKKVYHIYEQLRTRSGWGWDDERNLPVPPDEESIQAAIAINSDYKKYIDKPFPYKRQLDILCGKTTVRGSHFMGSTQDVDVEATQSFGDDDSDDRQQFNAMGLDSSQFQSIDGDNFNPFDYPSSSQRNPPSRSVGEKTPTNIHQVEDEATSPTRRRTDHASIGSRKRKSKKSFDPNVLSQYCMLNNERINMVRSLFPNSSSTSSTPQEQYTMRECVVRMKSLPGPSVDVDALVREILCEENALFLAIDEAIADEILESNEEHSVPRPMHTSSHTGHIWINEVLQGHEGRCYNVFRLHPTMFMRLRDELMERDLIRDSRYVKATEKLAIFMYAMGHGVASGAMCEHFQHSFETISKHVREVTKALASLRFNYIKLPTLTDPVHPRIRHDDKFYPYFKDAIGAIDGTHIPAHILREKHARYRNRKGVISQNVMGFNPLATGFKGRTLPLHNDLVQLFSGWVRIVAVACLLKH
ncbi:hypothetical protein Taro_017594 [Colocasia esculenta]|uniref:Myb/SANT-like domain-containing protein n=1 Tax=Colocasia esculenta TaxID=4460 RepID=A0A843UNI9_COLES|nr:hypothetical protein [Colocasia esculenta]